MEWSKEHLEQWHILLSQYRADISTSTHDQIVDAHRKQAQLEIAQLLQTFIAKDITLSDFNKTFQQKVRGSCNAFGLKGPSGGMFLSKLLKYIGEKERLSLYLRTAIEAPRDITSAESQMHDFICYLEQLISTGQVMKQDVQPARTPFFLSALWHIQDEKPWPIFSPAVRSMLALNEIPAESATSLVNLYFLFRFTVLSLVQALGISLWEFEHFCQWSEIHNTQQAHSRPNVKASHEQEKKPFNQRATPSQLPSFTVNAKATLVTSTVRQMTLPDSMPQERWLHSHRSHILWLLAKIGQKVGCRVWIGESDHNRIWNNERLGDISLSALPTLTRSMYQDVLRKIDVLWLQKNEIVAAYELDQTEKDISPDLLRLSDLKALFPKKDMHLCVVAPHERFTNLQFELSRPIFHKHELHRRCMLISEEALLEHEEHILRWAASPTVIKDLALIGVG